MKNIKKVYTYKDLCELNDNRIMVYALRQLQRELGYEPQPSDVINVLWDEHFKVLAC